MRSDLLTNAKICRLSFNACVCKFVLVCVCVYLFARFVVLCMFIRVCVCLHYYFHKFLCGM